MRQSAADLMLTEHIFPTVLGGNFVRASSQSWVDRSTPNLGGYKPIIYKCVQTMGQEYQLVHF